MNWIEFYSRVYCHEFLVPSQFWRRYSEVGVVRARAGVPARHLDVAEGWRHGQQAHGDEHERGDDTSALYRAQFTRTRGVTHRYVPEEKSVKILEHFSKLNRLVCIDVRITLLEVPWVVTPIARSVEHLSAWSHTVSDGMIHGREWFHLSCFPLRGQQVSHQVWILGNVLHVCLHQMLIRLPTLRFETQRAPYQQIYLLKQGYQWPDKKILFVFICICILLGVSYHKIVSQ